MKKILITTNVIAVALIIGISVKEKYPQRLYKRIDPMYNIQQIQFNDNPFYQELTDLYTAYSGQKNIVMLGDSMTYRICWTELLCRDDIVNRGIGSDITEGFINRMNFVLNVKPKICFIEGGVNDLSQNVRDGFIIKNLNTIIDTLLANKVKSVLTTVNYVSKTYPGASTFNIKVKKLNLQIKKLANDRKIDLIDLNIKLTDGEFRRSEYATNDGVHFTSKAYKIWREEIIKVLDKEKI